MSSDIITSISTTAGKGFFGGLLLGFAIKKVVKVVAVIAGLFIAGLAYLQYQQVLPLIGTGIEVLTTGVVGEHHYPIFYNQDATALLMGNSGIPLTGSMLAGFAVGFMKE